MRAHGIIGIAALSLLGSPVLAQPSCVECVPAIPLTSHEVTTADYPLQSIQQQEQGSVGVQFIIGEAGDVTECNVDTSSGHPRLDDAACAMIRSRWKYKPATANGQSTPQNTTANIVFLLRDVPSVPATPITSHAVTTADYPLESVQRLEQGLVGVRFIIGEAGDVTECNVGTSSGHPRLDEAACALVRRWKYKPATAYGQAMTQNTSANIVFQLSDFPSTGLGPIPPPPSDPSQLDPVFDIPDSYVPPSGSAP